MQLAKVVRAHRLLDARNALDAAAWVKAGWTVRCLGRPTAAPEAASRASVTAPSGSTSPLPDNRRLVGMR